MRFKKFHQFLNTRWGYFTLLASLFWLKTILVYLIDFRLGVKGIYEYFVLQAKNLGLKVETGSFGAHMKVELLNDGPVTILLEN